MMDRRLRTHLSAVSTSKVPLCVTLVVLVAAAVALSASVALATYVPAAGFATSTEVTCAPFNSQGFAPWRPTAADLNGDGIPDIVSGSGCSSGGIGVAMGLGNRRFSTMTTIGLDFSPSVNKVLIGDINGDGIPDLVPKRYGGQYVWTMIGHGDGTFDTAVPIQFSFGTWDAELADMDNDGHQDIVVSGTRIQWRKGDGAGGFATQGLATDQQGTLSSMDMADLNGDGILDIATTDLAKGQLLLYQGNGNGFTLVATQTVDGTSTTQPYDVGFVQLDHDAQPEIVLVTGGSAGSSKRLDVYDGSGFSYTQSASIPIGTYGSTQLEVGDVDQDGWDDVMVQQLYSYKILGFDNDGSGSLTERYDWTSSVYTNGTTPFGLADAGGDGRLDVLLGDTTYPGKIVIGRNTIPPTLSRVSGANRYATGAAASASAITTADVVVVATGENFPDALSAAGLCGVLRAPLLLVQPGAVPASVTAEIGRLHAKKAYIVGSEAVIAPGVAKTLAGAPLSLDVTRVAGSDRYDTSRKIAAEIRRLRGGNVAEAFVARGDMFPDALAASPLAFSAKMPIVLTRPGALSPAAGAALNELGTTHVTVLGSDKAVTPAVYSALVGRGLATTRVAGDDRYLTAAAIARFGVSRGLGRWRYVCIATGANFPDALAGGAACGNLNGLLLLTRPDALSGPTSAALHDNREAIGEVRVLGGTPAVSNAVFGQIGTALQ